MHLKENPRFNTIPCIDGTKKPAVEWKKFQDEMYDKPVTSRNYAVMCGKTSNVIVIDCDHPDIAGEIFDDFDAIIAKTLVVQTGRGGHHVYVEYDESIFTSRFNHNTAIGKHIDIQSQGTIVIGPESIHENGNEYKMISPTDDIVKMSDLAGFIKGLEKLGYIPDTSVSNRDIAKGTIPKGSRNTSAFKYACNLFQAVGMDEETGTAEMNRWNRSLPAPLDQDELDRVVQNAVNAASKTILVVDSVEHEYKTLRDVKACDEDVEVVFDAFVSAIDEHRTVNTEGVYGCQKGHDRVTRTEVGDGFINIKTPKCAECGANMFVISMTTNDVRIVVLQELPEDVQDNNIFRKTAILVGTNAVDSYISTQRLRFTGTLKSLPSKDGLHNNIMLYVRDVEQLEDVKNEIPTDEEMKNLPANIMDSMCSSFAPEILGYKEIKKAILLHLVEGGNMRRDNIHLLLIGNPSKAKSELLKATNKMVTSSYINGKMASGAGLAVGMVKLPNGTSVAQVGPLGLSKFVQLDELDKMKIEDRGALLEVMEQQSISLTKAGVNSTISAKPSILCAANPKYSTWDSQLSILKNVNFESFLLTRFDLTIGLITEDRIADGFVYDHIINGALAEHESEMSEELLTKYLNLCRTVKPVLTTEVGSKIGDFFKDIKKQIANNNDEYIPVETRQLEGIIRLVTAHAKIHLRKETTLEDVDAIIELFKYTLDSLKIGYSGSLHQKAIGEQNLSRDQLFYHFVKEMKAVNGEIDSTELINAMGEHKKFGSVTTAKKYFEKMYDSGKLLLNENGSYREPQSL